MATISFTPPHTTTYNTSVPVELGCTDPSAQIQYSTDGGGSWANYRGPIMITRTTTIHVKAVIPQPVPQNAQEILGTPVTYTIDTTPPGAPTVDVSPSSPTNNKKPTWTWQTGGNGGNGTFEYTFARKTQEIKGTTFTPSSDLSEGKHTFAVRERDEAGNWSAPGSKEITIDTASPKTVPNAPGADKKNQFNSDMKVTLNSLDPTPGTGVKEIWYTTDGTTPTNGKKFTGKTGEIPITKTTTINFCAVDNAGNLESVNSITYTRIAQSGLMGSIDSTPDAISGPSKSNADNNAPKTYPAPEGKDAHGNPIKLEDLLPVSGQKKNYPPLNYDSAKANGCVIGTQKDLLTWVSEDRADVTIANHTHIVKANFNQHVNGTMTQYVHKDHDQWIHENQITHVRKDQTLVVEGIQDITVHGEARDQYYDPTWSNYWGDMQGQFCLGAVTDIVAGANVSLTMGLKVDMVYGKAIEYNRLPTLTIGPNTGQTTCFKDFVSVVENERKEARETYTHVKDNDVRVVDGWSTENVGASLTYAKNSLILGCQKTAEFLGKKIEMYADTTVFVVSLGQIVLGAKKIKSKNSEISVKSSAAAKKKARRKAERKGSKPVIPKNIDPHKKHTGKGAPFTR